ncbi:hypothetical protein [Calothrix sp. PCC 7507]|uniref:hypothetical protein n=1 Tax=Calothrix sp. PCC 7507 TaxID=99598 RepID=UPI00029ECC33|nr:hypothetical protein [Calothrix sp. PCC 7507]AFY30926.1 hypothetical protein Cal7507_0431 [Calothrix sp. PCC 7507]
MKSRISVSVASSLILSASVYGLSLQFNKYALAQSQPQNHIAEIIQVQGGRVELKRENSPNYSLTQRGEKLHLGDLLRVAKGVKVVIQCNLNKTNWIIPDDGLPWGVANTCSPPDKKQSSTAMGNL